MVKGEEEAEHRLLVPNRSISQQIQNQFDEQLQFTPPPSSVKTGFKRKASVYNPYKGFAEDDESEVLIAAPVPHKKSVMIPPYTIPHLITINVSGYRFQTLLETLERRPDTLLGNAEKRDKYWNPAVGEYFFDRHKPSFEAILFFYQSGGYLHRPNYVPLEVFHEELKFFHMPKDVMIEFWTKEGFKIKPKPKLPKNEGMRNIWLFMEDPDSSLAAKVQAFWSILVILVASFSFMLETVPRLQDSLMRHGNVTAADSYQYRSEKNPFFVIECVCIVWFTIEFLLRIASCPSIRSFMSSFLNWIDFLAIVPFYISLLFPSNPSSTVSAGFAILRVLRLTRVFRIFKVTRYIRGLQILGLTFQAGFRELLLLVFVVMLMDVLFASAVYIAEYGLPNAEIKSIPEGCWYTIVTMTTNGYGDFVPRGTWGRIFGGICAVSGVLVIALPIPVIIKNFKHFYRLDYQLDHVNDLITRQDDRVRLTLSGESALKK